MEVNPNRSNATYNFEFNLFENNEKSRDPAKSCAQRQMVCLMITLWMLSVVLTLSNAVGGQDLTIAHLRGTVLIKNKGMISKLALASTLLDAAENKNVIGDLSYMLNPINKDTINKNKNNRIDTLDQYNGNKKIQNIQKDVEEEEIDTFLDFDPED